MGAGNQLLRIGDIGWRDLVQHFGGRVAQHALGANVEDLDDTLGVSGDTRKIGAVKNRVLQGSRLEQRLFRLLAHGDITQDAGEVTLTTQPHLAYRYLQREESAILASANNLTAKADSASLFARTVILKGPIAPILIKFGDQQAEGLSDKFCGGIAKHALSGRVHRLDDATMGMEGDDAVHHGIQNRLDQCRIVAQGLLRCIFPGDIAEHQHGSDHLILAATNRRATVGDIALTPITGNQHGVVGQTVYRALRQGLHDRDRGRATGFFVDDGKNFVYRAAAGLRLRPTGEPFGQGIEECHPCFGIGGDYGIADGVERHGELFLTLPQGDIGLLQLFVCLLLNLKQMLAFCLDLLTRGVISTDQQIPDDGVLLVAQGRDRHDCGKAAAIFADISQLVDVLNAA